ncbi:MAG: hypothetical protein FD129_3047 [bacterium]|nr:MAG: hypothetical protein FD129_3047 [bacterium]
MIRRISLSALLLHLLAPVALAWLPDNPLADPLFEEIIRLENDRSTSGRIEELTGHWRGPRIQPWPPGSPPGWPTPIRPSGTRRPWAWGCSGAMGTNKS